MIQFFKDLYLSRNFFIALVVIILLFLLAYIIPAILFIPKLLLLAFTLIFFIDLVILFNVNKGIEASRVIADKLSMGDENPIALRLKSYYNFPCKVEVIDEVPIQFQVRDTQFETTLQPLEQHRINYSLRPVKRGEYVFKFINVYVNGRFNLAKRRFRFEADRKLPVYPSIIQMKKFELMAFITNNQELGIKKMRRIGQSSEFEQIKEYIPGNDIRLINWKATARKNQLMINQYEDEKSQHIYNFIDKGRLMRSPFNDMTLLDYAINASLVLSNIVIKKQDKVGLLSFNHKVDEFLKPDNRSKQLKSILEILYNQKTNFLESNFSKTYTFVRRNIKRRSLLILYTNFNSINGLNRQMSYLRMINKFHLLLVVFFKNTSLENMSYEKAKDLEDVYVNTIAEKFSYEKRQIVKELNKNGIQTILTAPEDLTINTINKYLELKSRGMI